MDVCYWNRKKKDNKFIYLDLKEIFKLSDVIFLCLSINDETKKIVTDELLNTFKKCAIFISCTGKNLFNHELVLEKVKSGELFGYALEEPNVPIDKYAGNIMVTSEYAWFTKESNKKRIDLWIDNVCKFFKKS